VKVNPCLTQGRHPQIVEVQCQREYEGKGAFPNYVMAGVIGGFEENIQPIGLAELLASPKIVGIYSWSRGGGWYGPYIPVELWPDLNAYVLAQFAADSSRQEEDIFRDYALKKLHLNVEDAARFRRLCLFSSQAILKGRYCEAFDRVLGEVVLPTALWMRDDRLGGFQQLEIVLQYLHAHGLAAAALHEKKEALLLWQEIEALAAQIHWVDEQTGAFARVSAAYGCRLFAIIYHGWRMLAAGYAAENGAPLDPGEFADALEQLTRSWARYRELAASPLCPTLYEGRYFALPGQPDAHGLDESARRYASLYTSTVTTEATAGALAPATQQPSIKTVLGSLGTP